MLYIILNYFQIVLGICSNMLSGQWEKFKNVLLTVSNKCAPFETRRLKNRNNPWIENNIVRLIYKRDYLNIKVMNYGSHTNK